MDFGIIGFGRMGERYSKVIKSLNHDVKFVCDNNKKDTDLPFFSDYVKTIEKIPIDCLVISTFGPSHYEIMKYAISKNIKYVICEKPFTTSVKQADEILSLLKNSNTRLSVNYIRRFSKIYENIWNLLFKENCIGTPRSIIISSGAGGISTLGTHYIDLAIFLLNSKIKSVFAISVNKNLPNPRGSQFEDPGGYFLLNFENETRSFFEMGDDLGLQPKFEVIGEYGRMIIDEFNDELIIRARSDVNKQKENHFYGLPNPLIKKTNLNFESIETLIQKMIENLISDKELKSTANMARDKVEIYSALRKSFEKFELIKLPLTDSYYEKQFMVT
jgi:predicted dehydrogenase